jgi:hypothetical protein
VTTCTICPRRVATVCEPCRARITRQLATIPALLADLATRTTATHQLADTDTSANDPVSRALPAGPVPAASNGPRTSGGSVEPAAPIALDLIDTRPNDALLHTWARRWQEPNDPPAHNPAAWLTAHLDRACDQHPDQVAELAHDLDHLIADLRHATHDTRQLIGHCPTEDCGADLLADTHDPAVTCIRCGTTWLRRHWLWLADTLRIAA